MPNIFWYSCVILLGVGMIIFTMIKKRNFIDLFAFFLSATSLSYILEVIALFLFDSYQYKMGVFSNPAAENTLGHLTLNGLFWGGAALLIAVFQLRYYWIALFSAGFMLIDYLFVKFGLYEHHWWKSYFTGIGAFIVFAFIKKWYEKFKKNPRGFLRYFTFFFIAWVVMQGATVILKLMGKQHFTIGWIDNLFRDDAIFGLVYHLALCFIYVFFVCRFKKLWWNLVPLAITLICDFVLMRMNILVFLDNWNLFFLALIRIMAFIIFILLEKYSWRQREGPAGLKS